MRLVHISDIHVYDPSSHALQKAREWGKIAIAAGFVAGVVRAGSIEMAREVREQHPTLFRVAQGLLMTGLSVYLIRKIIDQGHKLAFRSIQGEPARKILEAELQSMSFDHLLVTGDVALTPSSNEFERAAEMLRPYWDHLHIVPGNHDVPFIEGSSGDFYKTFADRLQPFPIMRDLGDGVVLAGLDTTVRGLLQDPWAILSNARGQIADKQMTQLRRHMPYAGTRLLAMHHHLSPTPQGPGGLVNRIFMGPVKGSDYILRNMHRIGVDLVLHGHQHWNYHGPGFLCAGTACLQPDGGSESPTFNIYEFDDGKLVEVRRREIRGEKIIETIIPLDEILPGKRR